MWEFKIASWDVNRLFIIFYVRIGVGGLMLSLTPLCSRWLVACRFHFVGRVWWTCGTQRMGGLSIRGESLFLTKSSRPWSRSFLIRHRHPKCQTLIFWCSRFFEDYHLQGSQSWKALFPPLRPFRNGFSIRWFFLYRSLIEGFRGLGAGFGCSGTHAWSRRTWRRWGLTSSTWLITSLGRH